MYKDDRGSLLKYFGDRFEAVSLTEVKESRFSLCLQELVQDFGLSTLIVLDQIHSDLGVIVDEKKIQKSVWFQDQADFLITKQKNIALVVLTGDCVPLILHDPVTASVGLVHAGWKGSYAGVVQKTLHAMVTEFQTNAVDLIATFGPSARSCCYEVSEPFIQDFLKKYPDIFQGSEASSIMMQKNGKWYFDNSLFLKEVLKKFGMKEQNIYTNNALCTICNPQFCSFRREKENAGRQVSIVALQ